MLGKARVPYKELRMFHCNHCQSDSNIITTPDAHIICPVCGEGELVLDRPAVNLEAGLALVKLCNKIAEQGRENILRNRLEVLREQYLKNKGN